jgi:LPS sulfotransferase NodH
MLLTAAALGLSPDRKFGGDHEAHANAHIWQTLNTQAASAPEPYRPPVPMRRAMDRNWTVAAVPVAAEPEVPSEEQVSAPPSLNAALNQANEASAAAAMPVFPNVDLEVLEETQAEMDITRFVVLSQARSGSTWLVNMLNSHPNVLAFGEYLSSWAGNNVDGDGLVCKPQERLAKLDNINDWKQCSEWNFADKRKWLEAAKTGPVAMGFKWFNHHGGWDLDWARHQKNCPTDGCQTCKEPSDFSSWIHDKNVKLILLERSASLPYFISEMKQHAFGTNRCTDPECAEKVAKQKVRVDLAQMHRWFNYTTDNWDMMKDFARRSSLERQFFTYDEMCDRPQEIANDLFRFLRLEPWRVNTSQAGKVGGAVMRDSIENADEVASVLKGTVFEGQVDEEFASWRATELTLKP